MATDPVVVSHAQGSYPVYVEPGAIGHLGALVLQHLTGRRVAMLVDETVLQLYRSGRLGPGEWTGETLTFRPG